MAGHLELCTGASPCVPCANRGESDPLARSLGLDLDGCRPRPIGWMRVLIPVLSGRGCPGDPPCPIQRNHPGRSSGLASSFPRPERQPFESRRRAGTRRWSRLRARDPGPERTISPCGRDRLRMREQPRLRWPGGHRTSAWPGASRLPPFLPQDRSPGSTASSPTRSPHSREPGLHSWRTAPGPELRPTEVGLQWTLYDFGEPAGATARRRTRTHRRAKASPPTRPWIRRRYGTWSSLARAFHRVQVDAVRRRRPWTTRSPGRGRRPLREGTCCGPGAAVGEPEASSCPGRGVRHPGPPEQRHGTQRRLAFWRSST